MWNEIEGFENIIWKKVGEINVWFYVRSFPEEILYFREWVKLIVWFYVGNVYLEIYEF